MGRRPVIWAYHFPVAIVTPKDRSRQALIARLDELGIDFKIAGWRPGFSNALTVEFQSSNDRTLAMLAWPHHDHAVGQGGAS